MGIPWYILHLLLNSLFLSLSLFILLFLRALSAPSNLIVYSFRTIALTPSPAIPTHFLSLSLSLSLSLLSLSVVFSLQYCYSSSFFSILQSLDRHESDWEKLCARPFLPPLLLCLLQLFFRFLLYLLLSAGGDIEYPFYSRCSSFLTSSRA
jgi:hypothetical protein